MKDSKYRANTARRDTIKLSKGQVKVAQNAHQRLIAHIEKGSHATSSLIPDVRGLMRETQAFERQATRTVQQQSRQFQTTQQRTRQNARHSTRNMYSDIRTSPAMVTTTGIATTTGMGTTFGLGTTTGTTHVTSSM